LCGCFPEKVLFSTTSNYKLDFEFITPKIEKQENVKAEMPSDKNIDYLKYFPRCKETTRRGNASRFKKFCIWAKKRTEKKSEHVHMLGGIALTCLNRRITRSYIALKASMPL